MTGDRLWTPCGDDPDRKHLWGAITTVDETIPPAHPDLREIVMHYEQRFCALCGVPEYPK